MGAATRKFEPQKPALSEVEGAQRREEN